MKGVLLVLFLAAAAQAQTVRFYSFTRANPDSYIEVFTGDISANPNLSPNKKTYFVTHGFTDNGLVPWILAVKDAFLRVGDFNVITMDYPAFLNQVPGSGQKAGQFYDYLASIGYDPSTFHCSGHSLGGHMCGYSGQSITAGRLGRITGIDAAGADYEAYPANERLSPDDADMVDCIHTDGGGSGFSAALGKVDFFANGGSAPQPGCGSDITGVCSHLRAIDLFTESIESDQFVARSCGSWSEFQSGACASNPSALLGPIYMSLSASGSYYLATNDASPFAQG